MKRQTSLNTGLRSAFAVMLIALSAISCTPAGTSNNSSFLVALPDFTHARSASVGAQDTASTSVLQRVMINVTGGTLTAPITQFWDLSQQGSGTAPTSFNLTVPRGGTGLVQLLAITVPTGSTNSAATLYYGDVSQSFEADQTIDLTILPVQTTTGAQGVISGRWLDSSGNGPTALVNMQYAPAGKPAMTVAQPEMHGGWFEFTAFEGINFNYLFAAGTPIFTAFNLDAYSFLSGDKRNMVVTVPTAYKQNNGNLVSTGGPWKLFLGFFGPGSGGLQICYDNNSADALSQLYNGATQATGNVPWAGSSLPTAAQAGVALGGLSTTNAVCGATASNYVNWLSFSQTNLQDTHGALGFNGPFRGFVPSGTTSATTLTAAASANAVNLSYWYMPGTTGIGRVNGVGIFARTLPVAPTNGSNMEFKVDAGYACNRLTDSALVNPAFSLVQRSPVQNLGVGLQNVSLSGLSTTDFNAGKVQLVVCPYSDSQAGYFSSGLSYSAGNNGGGTTNNISVTVSSTTQSFLAGVCTPVNLNYLVNNAAATTPAATAIALAFQVNGTVNGQTATGSFYTAADCLSGMITGPYSMAANTSQSTIYFQSGDSSTTGLGTMQASISGGVASTALNMAIGLNFTSPQTIVQQSQMTRIVQGGCYPINLALKASPGYVNNSVLNVSVSDTGGATALYSDSSCQSQITNPQFQSTEFFKTFYYAASATATGNQTLTLGVGGLSTTISYNVASPTITTLAILANSNQLVASDGTTPTQYFGQGSCIAMRVLARASNNALTSPSAQSSVIITGDGTMTLSATDATCATGTTSAIQMSMYPQSTGGTNFFYVGFPNGTGSTARALTAALSSPTVSSSSAFYLQPDVVTLSTSNAPTATSTLVGFCQPIQVKATYVGGAAYIAPVAGSFTIQNYGGTLNLYTAADCGTLLSNNLVTYNASEALNKTFYMVSNTPQTNPLTATFTGSAVTSSALPMQSLTFAPTLKYNSGNYMNISTCYPVDVYFNQTLSVPGFTLGFSAGNANIDLTASSNSMYFYSDMACSSANGISSITFPQGTASFTNTIYMKFNSNWNTSTPSISVVTPTAGIGVPGFLIPTAYAGPTLYTYGSNQYQSVGP